MINGYGTVVEIQQYISSTCITVSFSNCGYTRVVEYADFKKCNVKSPFDKGVYDVGFVGVGNYPPTITGRNTTYYDTWRDMIRRCYGKDIKNKTYIGCTVCESWHNFQNFAKWYDENYYDVEGQTMNLDKDILIKGNKVYSPETCIFVPQSINKLFTKTNAKRGNCPIGVYCIKGYYKSQCSVDGTQIYLGRYNTKLEAFESYKSFKEKLIKQIADSYKHKVPQKLYDALYKYEVDITD